MSFIFGKRAEDSSVSNVPPRITQDTKPMTKIELPFAKYLGEEAARALLQDIGVASEEELFNPPYELPSMLPDSIIDDCLPELPPLEDEAPPEPEVVVAPPVEEPPVIPDVIVPDPTPVPPPAAPEAEPGDVAKILSQMTNMIEQMNAAVMSRVDDLEASVQNRAKDIRESFYKSHLDVIDVGNRLKKSMYEAELMDLEIQKKTLAILDDTEDKSIERAAKIKSLGIFGS